MVGRTSNNGYLVVIEGIDGTGKSSQARMLKEHHERSGKEAVLSFEPTKSSEHGVKLRTAMMDRATPLSFKDELFLFIEDRKWHVANVIAPALRDGKVVILDRYYLSTAAYQGTRGFLSWEKILDMNELFAPKPDIVFLLTIDVDKALERIDKERGSRSYFEKHERLDAIQTAFIEIHKSNRYNTVKIDASLSIDEVHESIMSRLNFKKKERI